VFFVCLHGSTGAHDRQRGTKPYRSTQVDVIIDKAAKLRAQSPKAICVFECEKNAKKPLVNYVKVVQEWTSFERFLKNQLERPQKAGTNDHKNLLGTNLCTN
jgi:urocanate hydratase